MEYLIASRRVDTSHITRAKSIAKTLGIRLAARYLAKRGWSLEAALWILLGTTRRR